MSNGEKIRVNQQMAFAAEEHKEEHKEKDEEERTEEAKDEPKDTATEVPPEEAKEERERAPGYGARSGHSLQLIMSQPPGTMSPHTPKTLRRVH